MWNEHSVCEREIEDLKEEVEYYRKLHQNEYEARQKAIDELHTRRLKELFEMAGMFGDIQDKANKYEKALIEIVNHSEKSFQGEIAKNVLQCK